MAKKGEKESWQEMTVQELEARLRESEEKRFKLTFQHASNPLKNPMVIREARRQIAKIKTFLRQKAKVA